MSITSIESDDPWIGPVLWHEVAFERLVGHDISHYAREARRLVAASGLVHELQGNPYRRASAVARVIDRLAVLEPPSEPSVAPPRHQREGAELEVAILLCALVAVDLHASGPLVRAAVESASPWLRGLAACLASPESTAAAPPAMRPPRALRLV